MSDMLLKQDDFKVVGKNLEDSERIVRKSLTYWQDAWRRLKSNRLALIGLIIIIIITLMCVFAPLFSKVTYNFQDYEAINQSPSWAHPFGTDDLGRDLWVRCWIGGRISLLIAVASTLINVTIGVIYGGISGHFGNRVDLVMMRFIEIIYSVPQLIWLILLRYSLGMGLGVIILVISITGWGGMARIVRGQVLQLKQMEFVTAARALGASTSRIMGRHLIPNTMGPIIVNLTFQVPAAVFAEAFLSYLGLGVQPPLASWGLLVNNGTKMLLVHPYQLFFPAVLMCIFMLAFNIVGDGLRDALDPRLRD
jgi:oligopeptide transport system permease protein